MRSYLSLLVKGIIGNNKLMRKNKFIQTILPKNISLENKYIFKRREFYKMPVLKVKTLNNVFLTHGGILLKNILPVKRSLSVPTHRYSQQGMVPSI